MPTEVMDKVAQLQRKAEAGKRAVFAEMQRTDLENAAILHGQICAAVNSKTDAGACGDQTWRPEYLDQEDIDWARGEL